MFIPSTFKRPVSSWKALNLRKTLLMASSVRLKPLNCSRLPCVYAQETLTFLLTQKKTCVKNYVQGRSEERFSRNAETDLYPLSLHDALPISVKAAELFAFTLRVRAGNTDVLTDAEENVRQKLRARRVMSCLNVENVLAHA